LKLHPWPARGKKRGEGGEGRKRERLTHFSPQEEKAPRCFAMLTQEREKKKGLKSESEGVLLRYYDLTHERGGKKKRGGKGENE